MSAGSSSARVRDEEPVNLAAAGLLIAFSPVLLCAIGSVLRAASAFLVRFVRYLASQASITLSGPVPLNVNVVRPDRYQRHYTLDLISLVGLATLGGFAVAFAVVILVHPRGPRSMPNTDELGAVSFVHRTSASLRSTVIWVLPVAVLLFSSWLAVGVVFNVPVGTRWRLLATEIAVDAIIAVVAVLAVGGLPRLRTAISFVADLACFWPPSVHPLGGTTYRPSVCAGLAKIVEDARPDVLVLVGHSQGSVIAAWNLADRRGDDTAPSSGPVRIHLITCGSPVASLYTTFFPAEFSPDFYRRAAANVSSWDNFWRATDPIATPLANGELDLPWLRDHQLQDPPIAGQPVSGHSDYWVDPAQSACIAGHLATAKVALSVSAEPLMPARGK